VSSTADYDYVITGLRLYATPSLLPICMVAHAVLDETEQRVFFHNVISHSLLRIYLLIGRVILGVLELARMNKYKRDPITFLIWHIIP